MARIDEEKIRSFYLSPIGSREEIDALPSIRRVIDVVLHKHFSNYVATPMEEELRSMAIESLYMSKYNKEYDDEKADKPTTYAYGKIRCTIGNFLEKKDNADKEDFNYLGGEGVVEVMDEVAIRSASRESEHWGSELPQFILKYNDYLIGKARNYTLKKVAENDAMKLILYITMRMRSKNRNKNSSGLHAKIRTAFKEDECNNSEVGLMNLVVNILGGLSEAQRLNAPCVDEDDTEE